MEKQPPAGPGGGEPFPSFDPDFTTPPGSRGPAPQGRSPRPQPRPPAGGRPPGPASGQPNPWLVGTAVASVLAAVSIISFGVFGGGGTTSAGTTVATTLPGTTETTLPNGATTTTPDGTDTTIPGQTTIPGNGGTDGIAPIGDPIPLSELQMKANGIGPLEFGMDAEQVLGRFAATYGQETDDTGFEVGSGSWGECAGESVRVVGWGPLRIVVVGEASSAEFVSYRLDLKYGGLTSPSTDIATLSGLHIGDKVGDLQRIYEGFSIEFVVSESIGGLTFELRENSAGDILLWGPVDSSAEDALVTGIYSKDSCETPEPPPPDA